MTYYAFDAANPNVSISAMQQHGAIVAPVYIRGNPGGFAHADAARVTALRAAGLAPWPNWESTADFFRTASIAACKAAGQEAASACDSLGFPDDPSISVPFSFDYQVPASGYANATAQLKACQSGLGKRRAVGYGQSGLIDYWAAHGCPGGHWLMASTWGLSYNAASPNVSLVQSHDVNGNWLNTPISGTDINTVTHPEILGAWWPDNSPFGEDVALADSDVQKIVTAVWAQTIPSIVSSNSYAAWRYLPHAEAADAKAAAANDSPDIAALKTLVQQVIAAQSAQAATLKTLSDAVAKLTGASTASVDLSGATFPATITVAPHS